MRLQIGHLINNTNALFDQALSYLSSQNFKKHEKMHPVNVLSDQVWYKFQCCCILRNARCFLNRHILIRTRRCGVFPKLQINHNLKKKPIHIFSMLLFLLKIFVSTKVLTMPWLACRDSRRNVCKATHTQKYRKK